MSISDTTLRSGLPATTRLRAVRAAMLAVTAVASLALLLTTPFSAEEGEFIHALRNGEISTVAVGHSADFYSASSVKVSSFNDPNDIAVSWVNRFGFRRQAVLDQLRGLAQVGESTQGGAEATPPALALDPSASIARTAQRLGVVPPQTVPPGELRFDRVKWLSPPVTVLMVVVLLFGPQPRRMTKWGAFWSYLIPLNVGIIAALLRDSPWNPRMNQLPEPMVGDRVVVDSVTNEVLRRSSGWSMFLWSMVASFAISVVLLLVGWSFPTYVDPVAWSALDVAGNLLTFP